MTLLLRYRVPKIERHAAFGRMTDCDLENQSRKLITSRPFRHRSGRGRNQRTVMLGCRLQRSFRRKNNLVARPP
jgi:hypothetical protein